MPEASAAGLVDLLVAVSAACLGLVSKLFKGLLLEVAASLAVSLPPCVICSGFLLSKFVNGLPEGAASLAESAAALPASLALPLLNCAGFAVNAFKGLLEGAASLALLAEVSVTSSGLLNRLVRGLLEGAAPLAESAAARAAPLALLGAALLSCSGFAVSPLKGLLDGAASLALPAAASVASCGLLNRFVRGLLDGAASFAESAASFAESAAPFAFWVGAEAACWGLFSIPSSSEVLVGLASAALSPAALAAS